MKAARRIAAGMFVVAAAGLAALLPSCETKSAAGKKVIIIGIDGMDPRLCELLMAEGELPHLSRLRDGGGYRHLGTSIPPQSPVAWSNFITGAGPGVHGIFDFVHRDPSRQCSPFYGAAQTIEGKDGWEVGDHKIPLEFWPFNHDPTRTLLKRHGTPFWEYLDAAGIPVHIYDIPANYPPTPSSHGHVCCLSGMGVPDLLGTYGTYQFFSEKTKRSRRESGGMREPLVFKGNTATATLVGPDNTYLKKPAPTEVDFTIHRSPTQNVARIEIQDQTIVLSEGEWSEWCKVSFEVRMPSFIPDSHVSGICRFYLQRVHPDFRLYVGPLNIDPSDPGGQQITEPPEFISEISDELGLFYTSGFQEDHNALTNKVFKDEEYRRQADHVMKERLDLMNYAFDRYEDGLLFFYFSSTDLQAHMFWWDSDDKHPFRSPDEAKKYHGVIKDLYRRMDTIVGEVVERFGDDATIIVMSDHGFANFRRQFNLNTWLRDNGYLNPPDCEALIYDGRQPVPVLPEWSSTRAYGLGINGLYINLWGRERDGIVDPAQKDELIAEITEKLLAIRDPENGRPVIAKVYRTDEVYSGPEAKNAPDLIVGYYRGYRASWATVLGDITDNVFADNKSAWSADHCIAADQVPGVLFSNRIVELEEPSLVDLAPTILREFGLSPTKTMTGSSLFHRSAPGGVNPTLTGVRSDAEDQD